MSRTQRRDYRGRPVREGHFPYRCGSGRRCTYCGPATVSATKAREAAADAGKQVAEALA